MIKAVEAFLGRWSPAGLLAVAVGVALLSRLAAMMLFADVSHGAMLWEYGEQAVCALRAGGDLCLAYANGTGSYPSAYMPPLLSYYWLILFHLFGDGTAARVVWLGSSLAIALVNIWLVFSLAIAFGRSKWTAFLAAGLLAVYPTFVFVSATYHQTNWAVFFLLAIAFISVRIARGGGALMANALVGGLLCGLATLNRSEMLLIGPALLGLGALWRWSFPDILRVGLVGAAAMVLTLAPWVARNYQLFERVIPVAQSTGYNLWKGFNPYTNGSGNMTEEPPGGPGDTARMRIRDAIPHGPQFETALQDAYMAEFKAYMATVAPSHLVQLSVNKALLLWGFDWTDTSVTGQLVYRAPWAVANLLVLLGLVVLWRDRRTLDLRTVTIIAAALALLTAAYVATAVHSRYRMHIEPFLFIAAGAGAEALLAWLGRRLGGRPLDHSASRA